MELRITPAQQIAFTTFAETIRIRPKVDFLKWAPREIRTDEGSFDFRPYQIPIAAAIFNPAVYSVTMRAYSGAGKTYLFAAAMAYAITQLKLEIATQFPASTQAENWLRKKLRPFLQNTPALRELRVMRDVAGGIWFENGASVEVSGANSGGATRTVEVHYTNAEEIDAYVQDAGDEGDKLRTFERRTRGRAIQIHTRSGYPSVKGRSQIDAAFEASDGCRWFFDCPRCNESQYFHPSNIVHPPDRPELAEVECPGCAGLFSDAERKASSLETGTFVDRHGEPVGVGHVPSDEDGRNAGFHLNCLSHVGLHDSSRRDYLHEVAAAIQDAEQAPNPEKAKRTVVNTMYAESYEMTFESSAAPGRLMSQREDYDPEILLPDGCLALVAGADVNGAFISAYIEGWGERGETWAIDYADIHGQWNEAATWDAFARFVFREWPHPVGVPLRVAKLCLDTRFKKSTSRRWVRDNANRNVIAITGSNQIGAPILNTSSIDRETGLRVQSIGTHEAKDVISQELQHQPPEGDDEFPEGYTHFPRTKAFSDMYFRQLTQSEESFYKRSPRDGELYPFFQKTAECEAGTIRNEPLDCMVYARAARLLLNPNFRKIRANMERQAATKEKEAAPPRKRPARRRGSKFIGGFKA